MRWSTFERLETGAYVLGGELIPESALRRSVTWVCPKCIREDVSAAPQLQRDAAAYGRALWSFKAIRVCHRHNVRLFECRPTIGSAPVEFASDVEANWPRLMDAANSREVIDASPLERYIVERVEGVRDAVQFGDIELHALIKFCERAGGLALKGSAFRISSMSDEDLWRAGGLGYEILRGGSLGLAKFVQGLWNDRHRRGDVDDQIRSMLGPLDMWLRRREPEVAPLRAMMFEAVRATIPVGPGDVVFGLPVGARRLHSIETAGRQLRIEPTRLRGLLAAAMVLPLAHERLSDRVCMVDAVSNDALLRELATALSFADVCNYLTAEPRQVKALISARLLIPFIADDARGVEGHAFLRRDLDDFLRRLSAGAVLRSTYSPPIFSLPDAARATGLNVASIAAAMLDGRIKWRGRSGSNKTLAAILVNADEVRWELGGLRRSVTPYGQLSSVLTTSRSAAAYLVSKRFFSIKFITHPVNARKKTYISNRQIRYFNSKYISLQELAQRRGVPVKGLREALGREGKLADIEDKKSGAIFYLRTVEIR